MHFFFENNENERGEKEVLCVWETSGGGRVMKRTDTEQWYLYSFLLFSFPLPWYGWVFRHVRCDLTMPYFGRTTISQKTEKTKFSKNKPRRGTIFHEIKVSERNDLFLPLLLLKFVLIASPLNKENEEFNKLLLS